MAARGNAIGIKISADQLLTKERYADEFVCKLCHASVVGCCPQLTRCSHLFCGDCLQQYFERPSSNHQAKAGSAALCPVCETLLIRETDIFPIEKNGRAICAFLWRMIQGLKVRCNARSGCCDWKGEYGSYIEHLQCGTCKAKEPEKRDAEAVSEKGDVSSTQSDEPRKDCPPSPPSTCSEMPSACALEELNTDSSHDEWSSEGKSESGDFSSRYQVPNGEDVASLIQNSIRINATSHSENPSALDVQGPPGIFSKLDVPPPKTAKSKTVGKEKQESGVVVNNITSMQLTPQEVHEYEWQVAMYQMACAQHYQTLSPQDVHEYEWQVAMNQMAYTQQFQAMQEMQQYYQQAPWTMGGSM